MTAGRALGSGTDGAAVAGAHDQPVRRVLVFAIVALALLMMSVDATIVATALPALQDGLGTTINWAGWTITAYSFGFVLMLPVSGKLSDRYGRRRIFLVSVIVFSAASLCCGLAGNVYVLIVLRAVQAAGGAGFTPSATGIIVDHFGDARDRAVSLFGSIFPIGAMIGPVFGGLFVAYWSWRGVFVVNVPIGAAVVGLTLRYVPRDVRRAPRARAGLDPAGMAYLGAGILTGMLAASYLGEQSARAYSPGFLAPLVISVAALAVFSRHIRRARAPFIAPRLIHGPGFGAVNLVNMLYGGITQGVVVLVPLYAANRFGIDALRSGTLLIAQGVASVVLSTAVALALRRTGYRLPLYAGSAVIVAGICLLAAPPSLGLSPYAWLTGGALLVGAGFGTINPACRNAGLQLAPEHSATLAALRSMGLQIGSIVTVSIATAVLTGSAHPGLSQAWFDVVAAAVLVVVLPVIARVPQHRGAW